MPCFTRVCFYLPSSRSLRAVASSSVMDVGNVTLVVRAFFLSAFALDPRAPSFSICAHPFSCWVRRFWACFRRSVALKRPTVAISASSSLCSAAMPPQPGEGLSRWLRFSVLVCFSSSQRMLNRKVSGSQTSHIPVSLKEALLWGQPGLR